MRAVDEVIFSNISATPTAFALLGGTYGIDVVAGAWNSGSVILKKVGANNTSGSQGTLAPVRDINGSTAGLTANGSQVFKLPAGLYALAISAATGVYANIQSCPGE